MSSWTDRKVNKCYKISDLLQSPQNLGVLPGERDNTVAKGVAEGERSQTTCKGLNNGLGKHSFKVRDS